MAIMQPSRRQLLAASLGSLATPLCAQGRKRPNIVIILADDQGWGDLSINGNTNLTTPNIDSLARDGAMLDRFYVCAVCAPTRAEFLTGRYHSARRRPRRFHRRRAAQPGRKDHRPDVQGRRLRHGRFRQVAQRLAVSRITPTPAASMNITASPPATGACYFDPELDHNGKLVRGKGYISDDLTNHAIDFITQHKDGPFFCYLPFNTPHSPMQVPDRFFEQFEHADPKMRARNPKQEEIPMTRAVLAMCENIDWNVGRVLAKLDELKLADDTIVIYFSDNGPNSWRWNGGMKGRKGSVDEGGVRAPFLIRWPGHIKPGTRVPQIAGAIDLLPTLADLAGVPVASTKPLDGKSIKPLLLGEKATGPTA